MSQNCLNIVTSILRLDRHDINILIKFKTHLYEEYLRHQEAPSFCRHNRNVDLLELIIQWTEAQIAIIVKDPKTKVHIPNKKAKSTKTFHGISYDKL